MLKRFKLICFFVITAAVEGYIASSLLSEEVKSSLLKAVAVKFDSAFLKKIHGTQYWGE
jgi:hypothetical protein